MKITTKISFLALSSVILTVSILLFLTVRLSDSYHQKVQKEVDQLIENGLNSIANDVYNLIETENEAVQQQVSRHLKILKYFLKQSEGIKLSVEKIEWNAINQYTNEIVTVNLPKILIKNKWIGKQDDFLEKSAIVDLTTELTGATATIFQRMNERGDMIRIATTVEDSLGNRATGTFIPAIGIDGEPNHVIECIMKDQIYQGVAFVVNKKYITIYEPLKDNKGDIIGMIYVGVDKEEVESRIRKAILNTRVEETGYVYVLAGNGPEQGSYIISKDGERDGENIWDNQDKNGNFVIQNIINKAVQLKPRQHFTVSYPWQNYGESSARNKIAHVVYYEPWDWVIGVSIYEDELNNYKKVLLDGRSDMVRKMTFSGILISIIIILIGSIINLKITRSITKITSVAKRIADGNLRQFVDVQSNDEIGILANSFNVMTRKINAIINDLRISEEKYRKIFENSLEGIFRISGDKKFIDINPALAEMLGYLSPDEMIRSVKDIQEEIFVNSSEAGDFFDLMKTTRKVEGLEILARRKDKTVLWISINCQTELDFDGQILYYEGTIDNISKRKEAEEALQKSEASFRALAENSKDVIMRFDRNLRHIYVNPSIYQVTGIKPNDFIDKTHKELGFPADLCDLWETAIKKTFDTKTVNRLEFQLPNQIWIDWLLTPELDRKGRITAILTSARDISSFRKTQDALRESEIKFRQIADNVNDGFSIIDIETQSVVYMNRAWIQIWEVSEDFESLSLDFFLDKVHIDDRIHIKSIFNQLNEYNVEHRINAEEKERWIRNRGFPVKDTKGKTFRMVSLVSDVTEYKLAAEKSKVQQMQLMQADKMISLGILVAGVAHEINNPNNYIFLNSRLISKAWEDALPILDNYYKKNGDFLLADISYSEIRSDIKTLLKGIENGSQRISRIVKKLKNYAREEEYDVHKEIDLNEVIKSALTLMEGMIQKKTNFLKLSLGSKPLVIKGNFQRLEQVIINLLQNACDSLESKDKSVEVFSKFSEKKKQIEIIIVDEGIGIEPENIAKIMDPFFTTKRDSGGTGLGLSVSLGIIKDHNGNIEFKSSPGEGTTVFLTFPIHEVKNG